MTDTVTKLLDSYSISYRIEEHEAVYTVAEATAVHGESIVKNLLLKEEKGNRFVFVIMRGDIRLDVKKLATDLGLKKMQFAKPDILMEVLHVTPGSVSLFSLVGRNLESVSVVIDKAIVDEREVGFHPNDNTRSIFIYGRDIISFLEKSSIKYQLLHL